mmetsp:Transcript_138429/g.441622  ORF Transcript_138429/g.441622 Transcript_138429/m.441622 type:complete len:83 (+) Transcript_138429:217-465(+)
MCEFSVSYLWNKILPRLEKTTLSSASPRTMKNTDASSKAGYVRIVEFVTGWPANFGLDGPFRCLEFVIESMSVACAKRAAEV